MLLSLRGRFTSFFRRWRRFTCCGGRYVQRMSPGRVETVHRACRLRGHICFLPRRRGRNAFLCCHRLRPPERRGQHSRDHQHEGIWHDVITDLHAEAEPIPLQLTRDDWFGHKLRTFATSWRRKICWDRRLLIIRREAHRIFVLF
ncbi:Sn1-specific diacylglycerol lipase alpha-like protein [Daphnia magna]|uniref:Sn1-specific diacylglycerol lipase alpha-like protein n=1 Tax=Daphnia magna TaxID=35525 RepID=A0A165AAC8_9CRUS|nr:Sn1-specific diacylglycerol lipase alpha-like protein [Daphnia magna]